MLDLDNSSIQDLVNERRWNELDEYRKIGAVYDYVRNEILFGYNRSDLLAANVISVIDMLWEESGSIAKGWEWHFIEP